MRCTPTVVAFASAFVGVLGFATPNVTAETITVCASGCDYTSINAAIDASSNGDVIELAAETYGEGSVIDTDGKAITLRGVTDKTGAPASVLDGGGLSRVLQCVSGENANTVFENLVVQNGSATEGGGMYNDASSPTLNNCTFTGNSAFLGGGMFNTGSSPTLIDCTFTANSSDNAAGMYNENSDPALIRCEFSGHWGEFGGALVNVGSSPTLQGCTFSENEAFFGAGIWNESGSSPTLTFCTFTDNVTYDGEGSGIYNSGGSAVLQACAFSCNLPLGQDPIAGTEYVDAGCNCIRLDCVACDIGDDDSDGLCNELDGCPDDPLKTESGSCGCGVVDTEVHGDLDCDGDYDEDDILAGMAAFGIASGMPGDLDGDGDADVADFTLLRDQIGVETLGCAVADINGDGAVDGADFAYVLGYWGICAAP